MIDTKRASFAADKVLVLEDEIMLFFLAEDVLSKLGFHNVLHARGIPEALALLDREKPDVAMLDVNLGGQYGYPVARKLRELGVPFFFATGYGPESLPSEWADRPVVQKPYDDNAIERALAAILTRHGPTSP